MAVGIHEFSLLNFVLLFQSVNPVLTLNISPVELFGMSMERINGVCDLLPLFLPEITAVKFNVVGTPSFN